MQLSQCRIYAGARFKLNSVKIWGLSHKFSDSNVQKLAINSA